MYGRSPGKIDVEEYNRTFGTDCISERDVLEDCYRKVRNCHEASKIFGIGDAKFRALTDQYQIKRRKKNGPLDIEEYNEQHGTSFKDEKDAIADCYQRTNSLERTAEIFGVGTGRLRTRMHVHGIEPSPGRSTRYGEKMEKIPEEQRLNMTYMQIAKEVGCNPVHAWRFLKQRNLAFKQPMVRITIRLTEERRAAIRADRASGLNQLQLAKKHHVSTTTLAKILRGEL